MKFDHVAFVVPSIEEATSWYKNELGAKILYKDNTWGLISLYNLKIAFVTKDSHPPHIAFKIKSKKDVGSINILDEDFKKHRDGSHSAYLRDPFGKPGPLSSTIIITFSKFFSIRILIKLFPFEKEAAFCIKLSKT